MSLPRLVFQRRTELDFPADVARIVEVCLQKGYAISETDAFGVWQEESDSMCAGWLSLPTSDDELFECVMARCRVEA